MNAIKNNIQPLPEGKNADENNRSYLDALQKKKNCSIFKHSYIIKYRQSKKKVLNVLLFRLVCTIQ